MGGACKLPKDLVRMLVCIRQVWGGVCTPNKPRSSKEVDCSVNGLSHPSQTGKHVYIETGTQLYLFFLKFVSDNIAKSRCNVPHWGERGGYFPQSPPSLNTGVFNTGTSRWTALHRCCVFYRLKTRPSASKKMVSGCIAVARTRTHSIPR